MGAAVGNAGALIEAVERLGPHAVLTDIQMPTGNVGDDDRIAGILAAPAIRRLSLGPEW